MRDSGTGHVRDLARKYGARVAINGGRFNGAFAPDGLLVVDGQRIGQKRADYSGAFVVDADGRPSVTTSPDLRVAKYAVQGYPTLVQSGSMGITREDHVFARRTVVAQGGDTIVAMVTSPATMYQLAYMLVEYPEAFYLHGIDVAVNLSGDATTGFYARGLNGSETVDPSFWPNRDVIVFKERAEASAT